MATPNARSIAAQLNAITRLPGSYQIEDRNGYETVIFVEATGHYRHYVNITQKDVLMVSRGRGGKRYTSYPVDTAGMLDAKDARKVNGAVSRHFKRVEALRAREAAWKLQQQA